MLRFGLGVGVRFYGLGFGCRVRFYGLGLCFSVSVA